MNDDLFDFESIYQYNSFGVSNDPELPWRLASEGNIDIFDAKLFYYEAYEREIDSDEFLTDSPQWRPLTPVPSGKNEPELASVPESQTLLGYDVVVSADYLDHSPLSCNSMAAIIR